jgi:hypothetical protein
MGRMGNLRYFDLSQWAMRLPPITYGNSAVRPVQMSLGYHVLTLEALCQMPASILLQSEEETAHKASWPLDANRPDSAATLDELAKSNDLVSHGIIGLYAHLVTYSYSMFEAFAGDLWELALNVHPFILAELNGIRGRIEKGLKQEKKRDSDKKKVVKLEDIRQATDGTYALQDKMGTFLRNYSESFTSLKSIWSAYSAAFSVDSAEIDDVLKREPLQVLSAVRNTLVHKAGKADTDYVNFLAKHPSAPPATLGRAVRLDGRIVADLVGPAIHACIDLLKGVEGWIARH